MKLLKFDSYAEYKQIQSQANRLKFDHVFAEDNELRRIASTFSEMVRDARTGLCHGVRNGYEVQMLRRLLPTVNIIGTDISETAATIPNCIVWDMHEVKPEWIGSIDFIYSNSWDHTYDPPMLFSRWSTCLSARGRLYLAYTDLHSDKGATEDTKFDAFGCNLDELIGIVQRTMVLEDVLEIPPRLTRRVWSRTWSALRSGRLNKVINGPLKSRRRLVLVWRQRAPIELSGPA
jgi:hypothetical protein